MNQKRECLKERNIQRGRWNVNGDKPEIDETNRKRKRLKIKNRQKGRWNVNRDK